MSDVRFPIDFGRKFLAVGEAANYVMFAIEDSDGRVQPGTCVQMDPANARAFIAALTCRCDDIAARTRAQNAEGDGA